MSRLRSVQVLRAVAACAVAAFHARQGAAGWENTIAFAGAAGVDLFFVISGFIMAKVAVGRSPRQFLADRAWRLYPLWLIAVLPWLLMAPLGLPRLAASLTLWPVYGHAYALPALTVGWTLSFEILFYLAVALALATRAALPLALFIACFVLGFATDSALFDFAGNPMILEFLLGVFIARLAPSGRVALPLIAGAIAVIVTAPLALFSLDVALVPERSLTRVLLWGLPSAAILYAALCLDARMKHRVFDVPVLLGDASYSIYLFHALVLLTVETHWIAELALAILAGLLAHLWIERPILAYRRKRAKASAPAPALRPA